MASSSNALDFGYRRSRPQAGEFPFQVHYRSQLRRGFLRKYREFRHAKSLYLRRDVRFTEWTGFASVPRY